MNKELKITSLGGFGEVTRNMYCYEYGDDILLIDCGIGFPTEEMLGVDLLIPDVGYLKDKKDKIRGMILTHGHEDHIGGLPYILPQLPNFPIYTAKLTSALAEDKLSEYNIKRQINIVGSGGKIEIGVFKITFIRVSHSIPDTMHLAIQTPVGQVYHGADFKFDFTPVDGKQPDLISIGQAGASGVKLLISDSLGSERSGATKSEKTLDNMFEREIGACKGKFIVTTMSSSISRLQQVIDASIKHGRKIFISGRSMERNVAIAKKIGYLNVDNKHLVQLKDIRKYKNNQITLIAAGSQGQSGSALQRIAVGDHAQVKLNHGDHVLFSTDYIPGSETAIHSVIDSLYQQGATVTYADIKADLHVSGHGSQHDLMMLINLTNPEYFYPVGGTYRHLVHYTLLAEEMGYDPNRVLLAEGRSIIVDERGCRLGDNAGIRNVMVDGLGVGDVGNVVLRDRQVLAEEGIVVVLLQIDTEKKILAEDPDLISRGLFYAKPESSILPEARQVLITHLSRYKKLSDWHQIKQETKDVLERYFAKKLQRHPMILPVIIEV